MNDRDAHALPADKLIPGGNVLSRALDHLEEWLIATLIAGGDGVDFLAVLHRYGTGAVDRPLQMGDRARLHRRCRRSLKSIFLWLAALDVSWAQELCIYMFIWMAKFGAAYGVRTGIHVGVDVLVNIAAGELPQAGDHVQPVVRRVVHRHRRGVRRRLRRPDVAHRPAVQRSRSADVDRLSGDPARLRPDVLPLSAGRLVVLRTGELPHHDAAQVDGVEVDALPPTRCIPPDHAARGRGAKDRGARSA